jgi:hypothetical protein
MDTRICYSYILYRFILDISLMAEKLKLEVQWAESVSLTKFRFIWLLKFQRGFFRNRPIRNKNCLYGGHVCKRIMTK